jgi:hypothetical protein
MHSLTHSGLRGLFHVGVSAVIQSSMAQAIGCLIVSTLGLKARYETWQHDIYNGDMAGSANIHVFFFLQEQQRLLPHHELILVYIRT